MAYRTIEDLLDVLHPACPTHVEDVNRNKRRVEHGLLSVGLKIHCLQHTDAFDELVTQLGGRMSVLEVNYYKQRKASFTLVLPPVGSAKYAVKLLKCIETYTGEQLLKNPQYQIQVCNPCRLSNSDAGLLTLGFYLGSDVLRGYDLKDLETTFSDSEHKPRGRRITIYDGNGDLDRDFEYWTYKRKFGRRWFSIRRSLPFNCDRTDVLAATSATDIYNINLIATLLVHRAQRWWWEDLGMQFVEDVQNLLLRHELMGLLTVPWIRQETHGPYDDQEFLAAVQEVMSYALAENARLNLAHQQGGILYEMKELLAWYRAELVAASTAQLSWRPQ